MSLMPNVLVEKTSHLEAEVAFQKVCDYLDNSKELRQLDASYKCVFDSEHLTGELKGRLFSADMKVKRLSDGSQVDITVKLPLALSFAKKNVKSTLESYLEKTLHG